MLEKGEAPALTALVAIVLITVAWWALALWPAAAGTPDWIHSVRSVCFGTRPDGLPDGGGWLLLVGQPVSMLGFLLIVWGERVSAALRSLARIRFARLVLVAAAIALLACAGVASARVITARAQAAAPIFEPGEEASVVRRHEPAPPLRLVNQSGVRVSLSGFDGRPVILTFAFGHCETVCPAVVRQVLGVQEQLSDLAPVVLVVTLDPWRDTPGRLAHIARSWELGPDAHILGGSVAEVEAALDRWQVPRSRDASNGDIIHPPLVYLIDATGRVAWSVTGPADTLRDLLPEMQVG
jgi:cytochrome oxidase Cu insertion factor (SCO1/SenC/PrrC family)